jgi:hypothetical protein
MHAHHSLASVNLASFFVLRFWLTETWCWCPQFHQYWYPQFWLLILSTVGTRMCAYIYVVECLYVFYLWQRVGEDVQAQYPVRVLETNF